jgi:hypothetical protein
LFSWPGCERKKRVSENPYQRENMREEDHHGLLDED